MEKAKEEFDAAAQAQEGDNQETPAFDEADWIAQFDA